MRSFIAASLAGAAVAGNTAPSTSAGTSGNVANQCVNTCSPILSVSSACGLPVPSNYAVALNPSYWGNAGFLGGWGTGAGWGAGSNWGLGPGTGVGVATGTGSTSGWGNNFPFGWFGFKTKRDPQWGGIPANGFGAFSPANANGWLSSSAVNCVCSSTQYNIQDVGAECLTCLNSLSISNPFLNTFATQCGFTSTKKKREAEPEPAAQAPASNQAKYGGGYAGWSYPTTDNGGAVVAPQGSGSGAAAAAAAGAGSGGGAGGGAGGNAGAQPVFFSEAPKTSVQGLFAMTVVGIFATGAGFLMM